MASLQDDKGGAISSPTLGSQSSTDSTDRTISPGSKGKFERFEHKGQLEAVIRDPKLFKRLMKRTLCAECGVKCMQSRFGNVSALVLPSMIDMFWCSKCGRLLCEKHRGHHTCEKYDAMMAARRAMTAEEVRKEVAEAEQKKLQAEAEAEAEKAARDAEIASKYFAIKEQRKTIASKASHIASFIQRASLQAPAGSGRQELLESYSVANRISIELWNEVESPTVSYALREDVWDQIKDIYARAQEITGMQIVLEGAPLDVQNSWEVGRAPP